VIRASRTSRRCASAIALKTSDVVEERATNIFCYRHVSSFWDERSHWLPMATLQELRYPLRDLAERRRNLLRTARLRSSPAGVQELLASLVHVPASSAPE
jgi:hypothetical protein